MDLFDSVVSLWRYKTSMSLKFFHFSCSLTDIAGISPSTTPVKAHSRSVYLFHHKYEPFALTLHMSTFIYNATRHLLLSTERNQTTAASKEFKIVI